jgi:hypothetical protein
MEWSLKGGEYRMAQILFTEFNTGIPTKLLYRLPERDFTYRIDTDKKQINNRALAELTLQLQRSKYGRMPCGRFGYIKS